VGSLKENLSRAIEELTKNYIEILKKSSIYKTKSWGNTNQPDFLNMALEVRCNYSPSELLTILKMIESMMGREDGTRWGPRVIDIDILFYGNNVINDNNLTIPHKEFYNRPFAIIPLAEISPDFIPPQSEKCIKDYTRELNNEGIEIYCD